MGVTVAWPLGMVAVGVGLSASAQADANIRMAANITLEKINLII